MKKPTENLTKYTVTLESEDGVTIDKISFDLFDKKEIAKAFLLLLEKLKTSPLGTELEYWKQDKKYAYIPLMTVENTKMGIKRQIVKGDKLYYKPFDVENFIKLNLENK